MSDGQVHGAIRSFQTSSAEQRQRDVEHVELHAPVLEPAQRGQHAAQPRGTAGRNSALAEDVAASRWQATRCAGSSPSGACSSRARAAGARAKSAVSGWAKDEAVYCMRGVGAA